MRKIEYFTNPFGYNQAYDTDGIPICNCCGKFYINEQDFIECIECWAAMGEAEASAHGETTWNTEHE